MLKNYSFSFKKSFFWVLLFFNFILLNAQTGTFLYNGLKYEVTSSVAPLTVRVIANASTYAGDIDIPSTVPYNNNTYSVTAIGNAAFDTCTRLTSIAIPESVKTIGINAFYDCTALTSVKVLNSSAADINIDLNAFSGDFNPTLCRLYVPPYSENSYKARLPWSNFKEIVPFLVVTDEFFVDNNRYQVLSVSPAKVVLMTSYNTGNITIPETVSKNGITYTVTEIASLAFYNRTNIDTIILPSSITEIAYYAFYQCSKMTSINFPSSLTSIGEGAFSGCTGITSVDLPSGVTAIGASAFFDCQNLTTVKLPASLTSIGPSSFSKCSSLLSINIPSKIKSISSSTFSGCTSLASITLPKGLTAIGEYAFTGCNALVSIKIPEGVSFIRAGAFSKNEKLTSINIPYGIQTIENSVFAFCPLLDGIVLPATTTTIGDFAFKSCTSLKNIKIPSGVTSIGDGAFSECTSLTSFVSQSYAVPTLLTNAVFEGTWQANCNLYVPLLSLNDYKSANYWKNFKTVSAIPILNKVTSGLSLFIYKTIKLFTDIFKPQSNLKLALHSTPRELSNIKVSSSGEVDFSVPFPSALEQGMHKLLISGTNSFNEPFNDEIDVFINSQGLASVDLNRVYKFLDENTGSVLNAQNVSDNNTLTISYVISGSDANLFTINSSTGKLDFIQAPDFEKPTDQNKDNVYEVIVNATEGGALPALDAYLLKIKVRDVKEVPAISSTEQIYVGNTSLSIKGSILSTGGDNITEKGYLISSGTKTNSDLQVAMPGVSKVLVSTPVETDLSILINNLIPNTDYSIRYFAKNASGIGYGEALNFHTLMDVAGPKIIYPSPNYYSNSILTTPTNHGTAITAPADSYGTVSTFAGSSQGDVNGSTLVTSKFDAPMGILLDADRNIYFADQYNHKIKKINREIDGSLGTVSVLAGSSSGAVDASGASAKFSYPAGLAYDGNSALYVADYGNDKIRKVTLAGLVTTIASGLSKPTDVVYRVENDTPYLYVADAGNHCIKKINLANSNSVSVYAGTSGTSGTTEGALTAAKFNNPTGLAFTKQGVLYVVDRGNNKIRKIENGTVSTFAGSGTAATTDGSGAAAAFDDPYGILLDGAENMYVTQAPAGSYPSSNPGFSSGATTNNYIRIITPSGTVSTFAGKGTKGLTNNAVPTEALLSVPTHLAIDKNTNTMYVSEWMGDDIRSIQLAKGYEITPALPSGVSLNKTTGAITGNVSTQISPSEYTVTASNYYGSSSAPVSFILKDAPKPYVEISTDQIYDTNVWGNSSFTAVGNLPILERGVCWSKTNNSPNINDSKLAILNNTDSQNFQLYGLEPNTLYYIRAYATTSEGTFYSPWIDGTEGNPSFVTRNLSPSFYYEPSASYDLSSNVSITPVTLGGAPSANYEVSPPLPSGLSINAGNGEITGVPLQTAPLTTYVVKTSNAAGISYAVLNFEVVSASLATQNILKDNTVKLVNNPVVANEAVIYFNENFLQGDLEVYDTTGRLLTKRHFAQKDIVNHLFSFDFNKSAGVYFMRIITDKFNKTLKIIKK